MFPASSRLVRLCGALLAFAGAAGAGAHPSHPLEPLDYPVVAGFENFFIQEDTEEYLAQGGELLMSELNCVGCHAPKSEPLKERIPGKTGPALSGVGSRLKPEDLGMMIRNPRQLKQGTTMPSLFAGPDRDPDVILALTHFLVSQTKDLGAFPVGDAARGKEIYHSVGCVACHSVEEGYRPKRLPEGMEPELPGFPSVPLALCYLYKENALAAFLHRPLEVRPSGRMPDMKLDAREAADIARYLKENFPDPAEQAEFALDAGLVERGRELFVERKCIACHDADGVEPPGGLPRARALEDLRPDAKQSCLAESPQLAGLPFFYLDFIQREAISIALKRLKSPDNRKPLAPAEEVDRTMTIFNCYGCHSRGGKGGAELARSAYFSVSDPAALSLGDFGNMPPVLNLVGRKLTREWMEKILYGEGGEVRSYMTVRMPRFGRDHTEGLVDAFALADVRDPPVEIDTSGLAKHHRAHLGRQLMGVNGLACVTCHGLKDAKAIGAPALNLTQTVHRLQPGYFKELLLDPQTVQPGTLMPPMFMGRKDAVREVEQIWTYLKEIDQDRLPDGLLQTEDFELKPEKEPIVFRTFLEGAGMQAIAVGFPGGVNVAFDALEVRWAVTWRGRFLDALTTWEERNATPAKPLGEDVHAFPLHMPLARGLVDGGAWPATVGTAAGYIFKGYRIGANGSPVFLYSVHGADVEDRIEPQEGGRGLRRVVTVRGKGGDMWFLGAGAGASPQPVVFRDGQAAIEEEIEW